MRNYHNYEVITLRKKLKKETNLKKKFLKLYLDCVKLTDALRLENDNLHKAIEKEQANFDKLLTVCEKMETVRNKVRV